MTMFDRFTDRARRVMSHAQVHAERLQHEYIGTEHLLLGLVSDDCTATRMLARLGVDLERIRRDVEAIATRGAVPVQGNLPFTPRGRRVLELAVEEAVSRTDQHVGTEHLLVALVQESGGIAALVLGRLGVQLEATRRARAEQLGSRDFPYEFPKSSLRIGVIGAGGIVQNAHLPGYAKAKYGVSAICDLDRPAAEKAAQKFGIPAVCASVDELLARKDVDVVDVAIPEHGRPAVLPSILKARKPTLLQKPLAYTIEEARRIVDEFAKAKVPLAVNQNLRWSPQMRAARQLIGEGRLGQLFDLRWTMRNTCDGAPWAKGSWYSRDPRFQVLSWSIHHLDAFRFLLDDEAERVYCALPRRPGQNFLGDVCATAVIHFRGGAQVSMVDSNASTPGRPEVQELDVDGTEGSIHLELQAPRKFEYWLAKEAGADGNAPRHAADLPGEWYPDGFAGAMGDFLEAIEQRREPSVSGRRNLGTMALIDACYRSAEARQAVEVERFD
jgi:predicted dehydrogenase